MLKRTMLATAMTAALMAPAFAESHVPAAEAADAAPSYDTSLTAESVVATVNGTEITLGSLIVAKSLLPQQYQQIPNNVLLPGLISQLVDQELLSQKLDTPSLATRLVLESQARATRSNQVLGELVDSAVSEEAVKAAYDESIGRYESEPEYNASHILVESEDEAKALVEELANGADFAELAKAKSTGPSGPNGGSLGWFGKGAMVPEFEQAVLEMKDGEVSQPVQTQFGWHVIKLNETRIADAPTLDELRPEITSRLQADAIQAGLEDLRAVATIDMMEVGKINPDSLSDESLLLAQ